MDNESKIREIDVWIDESLMPYLVDFRAIKAYADSKCVAITDLSDEDDEFLKALLREDRK